MESFKKALADLDQFSKTEIEIIAETATNITGDHAQIYKSINELVKQSEELASLKTQLAQIAGGNVSAPAKAEKRKYTKKLPTIAELPLPSEKKKPRKETQQEIAGNVRSLGEEETIDL